MAEQIITFIKQTIEAIVSSLAGRLGNIDQLIVSVGGNNARFAAYIILAVLALMVISRILKLSFSILQKVVLPAAFLAWVMGNFLHFPFFSIFPFLVAVGSAWWLFKT